MMHIDHTPGPWFFDEKESDKRSQPFIRIAAKLDRAVRGRAICKVYEPASYQEYVANGRLIAAAPELLMHLKFVCMLAERLGPNAHNTAREEAQYLLKGTLQEVREVIARAQGEVK